MPLPANFSGAPGEDMHHLFRNLCMEFKKTIKANSDPEEIQQQMQRFIDISRELNWHNKKTGVYHKEAGEKAASKVFNECKRYVEALLREPAKANAQYLLDALSEVETMLVS